MSTIAESFPQTFRPELVVCELKISIPPASDGNKDADAVVRGSGAGSTVEIARANAYQNFALALLNHFIK